MRGDHVGGLRPRALGGGDELGVEAELQDGSALGLPGELRVDDFVGPCPESGRRGDAQEHVRPPAPAAGAERALDDDFRAGLHRLAGPRQGSFVDADALDDGDGEPDLLQMLDIPLFVAAPSLLENLLERVPKFWLLQRSVSDFEVQSRQMPAIQVTDEVGRDEQDGGADLLHVTRTSIPGRAASTPPPPPRAYLS